MFSKTRTSEYTKDFSAAAERVRRELEDAETVIVGAGAGLSAAAGYDYSGERFMRYFGDFREKYGFSDMYSGGFYPFETLEEQWAYWSRYIWINRYTAPPRPVYERLLSVIGGKDYFVLTTNVDHCFQRAGFDKKRLFYTQGDYGLFQCSLPCCQKTYDNRESVRRMLISQGYSFGSRDELLVPPAPKMQIPKELVPLCPVCGRPLSMNLRADDTFVQDEGWYKACDRYTDFLRRHEQTKTLFLELGVGANTPVIIKYPFWRMVRDWKNSVYVCINYGEAFAPAEISRKSICIDGDIGSVLEKI